MPNKFSIYERLPARYRRDDRAEFLRRFLSFPETTLAAWEMQVDGFSAEIKPATASAEWIEYWLAAFFGWTWLPSWFGLAEKRRLYANFARHLARRGTPSGIEAWLADFGIVARVHTRPATWQEFVWGDSSFAVGKPLHLIIEILYFAAPPTDAHYWHEAVWEESFYAEFPSLYSDRELADLLNFVVPLSQFVSVCWANADDVCESAPLPPTTEPQPDEVVRVVSPANLVSDLLYWARIADGNFADNVEITELPSQSDSGAILHGAHGQCPVVRLSEPNAAYFDGTKTLQTQWQRRSASGLAAYFVLRVNSTIGSHAYFLQFGNFLIQHRWDGGFYLNFPNQGHTDLVENNGIGTNKWIVLAAWFDAGAQTLDQIYIGATQRLVVPTRPTANVELSASLAVIIGQNNDVEIAEIILDDKNHTPDERTAIINHLRSIYGLDG